MLCPVSYGSSSGGGAHPAGSREHSCFGESILGPLRAPGTSDAPQRGAIIQGHALSARCKPQPFGGVTGTQTRDAERHETVALRVDDAITHQEPGCVGVRGCSPGERWHRITGDAEEKCREAA